MGADGTRGRILVVEDDPEAALFVVYVLANRAGFEVTPPPTRPRRSGWPPTGTGTCC